MLDLILGASMVVTAVLIVLIVASVASWAVIAMKFRELAAAERDTKDFLRTYRTESVESSYNAARTHQASPLAVVYAAGFKELARIEPDTGIDPSGEQVEQVIRSLHWVQTAEAHRLERGLAFLATVGSSAPFVGLLGTVIGIMNAFADIGAAGSARMDVVQTAEAHRLERGLAFLATIGSSAPFVGLFGTVIGIMNAFADIGTSGSASLAVVAPGIAEALIATAVGLFAAIPAVIAYNYTSARISFLVERLDAFLTEYGDLLRRTGARAA